MIRSMFCRYFMILVIGMPLCSLAQMPGLNGSSPAGTSMGAAILGKSSLSARVVTTLMTTVNGVSQEGHGTEYNIAISEGKIRVETDMEAMVNMLADSSIRNSRQMENADGRKGKHKEEIPTAADMRKMMASACGGWGMPTTGKTIVISIPSDKISYTIPAGVNACYEEPVRETKPFANSGSGPSAKRKVLGTETVEGYRCNKILTTMTCPDGLKINTTSWEAQELGGFTIRTEVKTATLVSTTAYKDIPTNKLPAALFEIPSGMPRYSSKNEMMDALEKYARKIAIIISAFQ